MRITVVVGNPKAGSRTLRVARAVSDALVERIPTAASAERVDVDLADVADGLFDFSSDRLAGLLETVRTSSLLIAASPTFKATYTGLLKAFFDRYGTNELAGVVAVPVMTGAAPVHALAVEVHLRSLLVELGASCPTRGLYVTEDRFDDLDAAIGPWADAAAPHLIAALGS